MPMSHTTAALITRALRLREATGRANLAAAQQEHASRAAVAAGLADSIVREQRFADATIASSAGAHYPAPHFSAWAAAAAARLAEAHHAAAHAEAACEAPREALADALRTSRGFETLLAKQAADRARDAARRDPLMQLMVLPPRGGGGG